MDSRFCYVIQEWKHSRLDSRGAVKNGECTLDVGSEVVSRASMGEIFNCRLI